MSDFANILEYFNSAKESFSKKNYLYAAINAYWCRMYCKQGQPYGMSVDELYNYERKANRVYFDSLKKIPTSAISKTQFILGCQCEKALWLHRNKHKVLKVSEDTQAKFDRGHIIGSLAQQLFPGGSDASKIPFSEMVIDMCRFYLPFNLKQHLWINNTRMALSSGKPIYEAAFVHDGVFAAVDILVKSSSGYIAYEVKSSPAISETYTLDSALQYYVLSHNIRLEDFVLVHLNNDYIQEIGIPLAELTQDNCDINLLFVKTSVLNDILSLQQEITTKVARFKTVALSPIEPTLERGDHCDRPYECGFKEYCSIKPLTIDDIY